VVTTDVILPLIIKFLTVSHYVTSRVTFIMSSKSSHTCFQVQQKNQINKSLRQHYWNSKLCKTQSCF